MNTRKNKLYFQNNYVKIHIKFWQKQADQKYFSGESEMKNWMDVIKNLTMLTQFGLSFITPIFLCLAACWWLNVHGGLGAWIYIPGFFFGLGGSFMVAYKLYLKVMEDQKRSQRKNPQKSSFNRHI